MCDGITITPTQGSFPNNTNDGPLELGPKLRSPNSFSLSVKVIRSRYA